MGGRSDLMPLAFVVAALLESQAAPVPRNIDMAAESVSSVLAGLQLAPQDDSAASRDSQSSRQHAQWFNWLNCFNGGWRRC